MARAQQDAAPTGPEVLDLGVRDAASAPLPGFVRLLDAGGRAAAALAGGAVVTVSGVPPVPPRVTELLRFPQAQRVLLSLGAQALTLVVLGPGERPGTTVEALRLAPGQALALARGVWHAGPWGAPGARLAEVLETDGPADRLDRRALGDLIGAQALTLPTESGPNGLLSGGVSPPETRT